MQSAERVSQNEISDNYVYQRSILAYCEAAKRVSGSVLEIGTGSGYGVSVIAPRTSSFLTIDKTEPADGVIPKNGNVSFMRMKTPPLKDIKDESMDFVLTFQVIEHIKDDFGMMSEIRRVLKPGGKLIISTPNKEMSLTRNPWHVREYTVEDFKELIGGFFNDFDAKGIFGSDKVMQYYENNKASVAKVKKCDVLRFHDWLPRWCLKLPYDIMNRRNRRKLLKQDQDLTASISMNDYYLKDVDEECFDLFFIAEK